MEVSEIREFIRKEVKDWDEESVATARFKAFSGQRSDWQLRYLFWRDLILRISRHFSLFILNPSEMQCLKNLNYSFNGHSLSKVTGYNLTETMKNDWFNRGGLTPLCLDDVLYIMYSEGDVMLIGDLADPTGWRLARIFKKAVNLVAKLTTVEQVIGDHIIVITLLKDRSTEVIKSIADSHWTSSCILTMKKFHKICGGSLEASAILSHLSGCTKARHLSIRNPEFIEGVKISISEAPVSGITSLDYNVLHLIWTIEMLQQQLNVIDQRFKKSKKSALESLRSGDKKTALRHARQLKLTSESREKCLSLMNRVEEVLNVIADAESTRKVSEAIQIGAWAIKENKMSLEEVQLCLDELNETIDSQTQIDKTLAEASTLYRDVDDKDIEEEFLKLELETKIGDDEVTTTEISRARTEGSGSAESLCDGLSNLSISNAAAKQQRTGDAAPSPKNDQSKGSLLEPA